MFIRLLYGLLFILLFYSCYKEEYIYDSEPSFSLELPIVLKFNTINCLMDFNQGMFRYPITNDTIVNFSPFVKFQDYSEIEFNSIKLTNNSKNNLGKIFINNPYFVLVKTAGKVDTFKLVFTNYPIIQIIVDEQIYNEPKSLGRINIYYPSEIIPTFSSYIGIELRKGISTQKLPKKSYGLSLWQSMNKMAPFSYSLFNLKKCNCWILDAAYNDSSRLRNKVSFDLWNSLSENNEDLKHAGIGSEIIELFINNSFMGLYCFSEIINSELLQLSDENAVLYKAISWSSGATTFETYNSTKSMNQFWDGWEQKYPDPSQSINWEPLRLLRDFVINSSDFEFRNHFTDYINLDNFIDYYLFINLIAAYDNVGKNTFLVRTAYNEPFSVIPWDLEGSWGRYYDGTKIEIKTTLSNALFDRLLVTNPDNINLKVKNRWFKLRETYYNEQNLIGIFDRYFKKFNNSDLIEMENRKWNLHLNMVNEQIYINNWIKERLIFLDDFFRKL